MNLKAFALRTCAAHTQRDCFILSLPLHGLVFTRMCEFGACALTSNLLMLHLKNRCGSCAGNLFTSFNGPPIQVENAIRCHRKVGHKYQKKCKNQK